MDIDSNKAMISCHAEKNIYRIICSGDWDLNHLSFAISQFKKIQKELPQGMSAEINITAVEKIDSSGAILILRNIDMLEDKALKVDVSGASDDQQKILDMYRRQLDYTGNNKVKKSLTIIEWLEQLGKKTVHYIRNSANFFAFLGETYSAFFYYLIHPSSIRYKAIIKNIEEAGVRALPIIALTSFLIGVVIAYQSAVQLEKFGASIFIVDMIGISVTRELSPLITAIVVAGRSGSSYTAQIGVMKITEEIDAMRTMGFNPFRFLVLPRMIALMIAMPLMIFFADLVGIFGGMFISKIQLNMSYAEFINRLQNVLDIKHVWVGLIKGPFFAWLIAAVGCYRGFQVSYNTESIGRYTTISVVNAIFLVIACDAVFSVILTELDI